MLAIFKIILFIHVCVHVQIYRLLAEARGIGSSGFGISGHCELPKMYVLNQILVFFKSSKCCWTFFPASYLGFFNVVWGIKFRCFRLVQQIFCTHSDLSTPKSPHFFFSWGERFIWLILPHCSLSLKEVRTGP